MLDHSPTKKNCLPWPATILGLLMLLLLGFWLRLSFLLGAVYFFDEYISMLAAQVVAQHGLPWLPSGLFYDHGLLLSLLSGVWLALTGFSEELARWPVLLMLAVTVAAAVFIITDRGFNRIEGTLLLAVWLAALPLLPR